jgi:lysophospholipase L1-like esterase
MKFKTSVFLLLVSVATPASAFDPAAAQGELDLPQGSRLVNGTGQLPIVGHKFAAPGFTSQGYIQICASAGPNIYLVGLNFSSVPLTLRSALKTSWDAKPMRVTYAQRNEKLKLKSGPEETVVGPMQFYVTDPIPLSVKAGQTLILRTFVPLRQETEIGCGIISVSEPRPDNRWAYGNVIGGEDSTLDPDLELGWKPNSDFLVAPFLVAAERVPKETPFVVAFGDSLTFQLEKDKGGTWFQNAFADVPHANLAIGGDALGNVITPGGELKGSLQTARFAVARYATDVINFYGHNDIGNGTSAETMLSLDKAFCARPEIAKARKWRCTLTPFTHNNPAVDVNALTEADQTPDKNSHAIVAYNKEVRTNFKQYGYDGVLDIGAALATGPNSLFWKPGLAKDGTHFGRMPANDLIAPVVRKILTRSDSSP